MRWSGCELCFPNEAASCNTRSCPVWRNCSPVRRNWRRVRGNWRPVRGNGRRVRGNWLPVRGHWCYNWRHVRGNQWGGTPHWYWHYGEKGWEFSSTLTFFLTSFQFLACFILPSAGLALCTRGGETRAGENGGVNIFLLAAIGVGGVLLFSW